MSEIAFVTQKILARCEPELNTGCLLWSGAPGIDGYGHTRLYGRHTRIHRIVFFGERPHDPGVEVMHKCDTPLCVNPSHLAAGDTKKNAEDRVKKNRNGDTRNVGVKSEEVVALKDKGMSNREVARLLGVHVSAITARLKRMGYAAPPSVQPVEGK